MPTELSLAPSEIRSLAVETMPAKRTPAFVAMQAAAAVACLSGFFLGASMLLAGSDSPGAEIKVGKIEDWPEIKNGVPDIVSAKAPASSAWLASLVAPTASREPSSSRELPVRGLVPASESAISPTPSASPSASEPPLASGTEAQAGADRP